MDDQEVQVILEVGSSSGDVIVDISPEMVDLDLLEYQHDSFFSQQEKEGPSPVRRPLFCMFCTEKLETIATALDHIAMHFDYLPIKCTHCSGRLKDMETLSSHHIKQHSLISNDMMFQVLEDFCLEKYISDFVSFQINQVNYIDSQVLDCSCADYCPVCQRVSVFKKTVVSRRGHRKKTCDRHGGSFFIEHLKVHMNYYPYQCLHCLREGKPTSMLTDQEHAALAHMGMRHSYVHKNSYRVQDMFPRTVVIPYLDALIKAKLDQRQSTYAGFKMTSQAVNTTASQLLKQQQLRQKQLEEQTSQLSHAKPIQVEEQQNNQHPVKKVVPILPKTIMCPTPFIPTSNLSSAALPIMAATESMTSSSSKRVILPKTPPVPILSNRLVLPNGQVLLLDLSQGVSVAKPVGQSLLANQTAVNFSTGFAAPKEVSPMEVIHEIREHANDVDNNDRVTRNASAKVSHSIPMKQPLQQIRLESRLERRTKRRPLFVSQPSSVKKRPKIKPFDGDFTKIRVVTEGNGRMVLKEIPVKEERPPKEETSTHFRIEAGRVVNHEGLMAQRKALKQKEMQRRRERLKTERQETNQEQLEQKSREIEVKKEKEASPIFASSVLKKTSIKGVIAAIPDHERKVMQDHHDQYETSDEDVDKELARQKEQEYIQRLRIQQKKRIQMLRNNQERRLNQQQPSLDCKVPETIVIDERTFFKCPQCGNSFSSHKSLKLHSTQVHSDKRLLKGFAVVSKS